MNLTTVAAVKTFLGLTTSQSKDDGVLQQLVDSANAAMTSAVSRELAFGTRTERYNGTGTNTLMLVNTPISAVHALTIVGRMNNPARALTLGSDFAFSTTAVKLMSGRFTVGVANVEVTYDAGYATLPADLVMATTKYVAVRYREIDRLGQRSKTLQGETVNFDLSELPPDVAAVANRYQVKIPVIGASVMNA